MLRSKRGSPYLRRAIWLAAISAVRFSPQLRESYDLKRAQGKHHYVAMAAVARKLVHIIHALWTQNCLYNTDYRWTPPGGDNTLI
ncbi:MAG: IS110 family transposase [Firmicutes bacterium]|nr:IS110 family transposase [Bacillota bacterium]